MKKEVELSIIRSGSKGLDGYESGERSESDNPSREGSSTLPGLIEKIQSLAIDPLAKALSKVHDQADNSLFLLAEKARNNNEQTLYFDAMRKIRLNREAAEKSFKHSLESIFSGFPITHYQNFNLSLGGKEKTPDLAITSENMALVENDELEENIALETMVNKARTQCQDLLYHLNTRLESLVSVKVDENNSPLDPGQIAEAFMLASTGLDLDIKTKLIVYKQVDLFVMGELESVLKEANQFLIKEGVLPELRRKFSKAKTSLPSDNQSSSLTESELKENISDYVNEFADEIYAEGVFNTLSSLLHGSVGERVAQQYGTHGAAYNSGNHSIVEGKALQDLLSDLQGGQLEDLQDWNLANNIMPLENAQVIPPSVIVSALIEALKKNSESENVRLGKHNEDVINLVCMLFEFILGDYNLPAKIQVLLSRLQIPVLKVALADPEFFDKHCHPARKLLNEIARACIGLDDNDLKVNDDLLEKVSHTVHRVLNEFSGDIELFQELYDDFKSYLKQKEHYSKLMEKRTLERTHGEARTKQVKELVKEILKSRLGSKEYPPVVSNILLGSWSNVLYTKCLGHGIESEEWVKALKIVDDLIWSAEAHLEDPDAQKKRLQILSALLPDLHEGLVSVGCNPFEIGAIFSSLERLHIQVFKTEYMHFKKLKEDEMNIADKEAEALVKELRVDEDIYPEEVIDETSAINEDIIESLSQPDEEKSNSIFNEEETREICEAQAELEKDIGPTAIEKQKNDLNQQKSYMQQLESIELGAWFEFNFPETGKIRCKLSKKLEDVGLLVFVGRFGNKILERSPRMFLADLEEGRAKALDNGSLLDRAIVKVFERLGSENKADGQEVSAGQAQSSGSSKKATRVAVEQKTKIEVSEEIEDLLSSLSGD